MRFLRYPGGKTKVLKELSAYLPSKEGIEGKYIEPFVGGGAVFFNMDPERALLSDLNKELIDLYKGIKSYPHKVWEIFNSFPPGKESYYQIRNEDQMKKPIWYRAARTLYLNRTCFKGMWRHNQQGKFNVGYGGEERRWAITHENIIELSKRLRKTDILNLDFEKILLKVEIGDFIFLDPPYNPGDRDMKCQHYINGRFTFEDQKRLAKSLISISKEKEELPPKCLPTN